MHRLHRNRVLPSILAIGALANLPSDAPRAAAVAWSQSTTGSASLFRPAVGPGGNVYTSNGGAVSAFSPAGDLLWTVDAGGASGPVSVGPDGTIYANVGAVGANPTLVAINPDGSTKWTFDAGANIHAGPNVGPDGRIYAIADTWFGGMGLFALDPGGNLLWSDEGDPQLSADTGQPHEIVFGSGRAFVAMATQGAGGGGGQPAALWAFDLDAEQQAFALTGSCQGQPVLNPLTGHLVTGNGICQAVHTYDATTGDLLWSVDPPSQSPCSGLANIAAGADGSVYTAFCYRAFWSLDAGGSERWFDDNFGFYFQMDRLAVTPDDTLLLDLGGDVGSPGWVRAFDTDTAALAWQLDLDLSNQKATSKPAFDEASGRAYFNANRFGANTSDLFAIDLGGTGSAAGSGGAIPDGAGAGRPLAIESLPGGQVRLTWDASCRRDDTDYAVYEAPIGDPSHLLPATCSTGGLREHVLLPAHDASFFLVVPVTSTTEGSYGQTAPGVERAPSTLACHPQLLGDPICPQ